MITIPISKIEAIAATMNAVRHLDGLFPVMIGLAVFIICICLAVYWSAEDQ